MKTVRVLILVLFLTPGLAHAQIGVTHPSLETLVASADLVVRGPATRIRFHRRDGQISWCDLTLKAEETLKGSSGDSLTITVRASPDDPRWTRSIEKAEQQLWFLVKSGSKLSGETDAERTMHSRNDYKGINYWYRIALSPANKNEKYGGPLRSIFTMHFRLLDKPEQILAETHRIAATEPEERSHHYSFNMPRILAARAGRPGDANSFQVPHDQRLEKLAHALITEPETLLPPSSGNQRWDEFEANSLRAEGAKALRHFRSEQSVALLKSLLDHPATVGRTGVEEQHYFVRAEAFKVLKAWNVKVDKPVLAKGRDPRPARNDDDLRYWLQNMHWHHKFDPLQISAALGFDDEEEVEQALARFDIRWNNKPKRAKDAPLLVLPYPGGRHPRIGFLDGAINPQRETKVSIFTPWDEESYVVADVPEAIWSNLGLTYLAHTHVPTIWTKQQIELEKLEWIRRKDGTFDMHRKLPNGIEFGTKVIPGREAVRMEMWLKNGTKEKLTDLRVQNCIMLKGARGFAAQTNDNKVLQNPYVAVHNEDKTRWIITAWNPCHRPWANAPCPCLHSDPKFPDCAPGETKHLRGWLSFYEGKDLKAELKRIEATEWRQ